MTVRAPRVPPLGAARIAKSLIVLGLAFQIGVASAADQGKKLYRWVDEHGEVHYTDQVPASAAKQSRTTLTEQGIRTVTVPEASTEAELRKAREAEEAKKAEEARRKEAQQQADKRLWMTYPTLDDLMMARAGRLAAVDAAIQVKRDALRRDQEQLIAAKVPELARRPGAAVEAAKVGGADEGALVARMRAGYAAILDLETQKEDIRAEFRKTISRYREIKKLEDTAIDDEAMHIGQSLANLVSCRGAEDCKALWDRSIAYVRDNTDKGQEIAGGGLFIGLQRDQREDRRFTLAWTQKGPADPVNIFLDLQCKNRQTASLVCTDEKAVALRDGFRSTVMPGSDSGKP